MNLALKSNKPTIIECLTYRLGDHTTADDARRYRDQAELDSWVSKDPLIRTRKYLEGKKLWNDAKQTALEARAKDLVHDVVARAEGIAEPPITDIFDYTYASLDPELIRQRETMRTASLSQLPEQERLHA